MHSLHLIHLREIADVSHHAIAIKAGSAGLLRVYTKLSEVYTHTPAAYPDVDTNTTAIPCTIGCTF